MILSGYFGFGLLTLAYVLMTANLEADLIEPILKETPADLLISKTTVSYIAVFGLGVIVLCLWSFGLGFYLKTYIEELRKQRTLYK